MAVKVSKSDNSVRSLKVRARAVAFTEAERAVCYLEDPLCAVKRGATLARLRGALEVLELARPTVKGARR
jgi:hypothetical protein